MPVDSKIIALLLQEYTQRRQQNELLEGRRRQEMRDGYPDIAKLMDERHEMVLGSARSAFTQPLSGDPVKQMEQYNRQIRALLKQHGYAEDYLSPIYACDICQDTGLTGYPLRQYCGCIRRAHDERVNAFDRADHPTFETFDETRFPDVPLPDTDVTQRELMRVIRSKCEDFANRYPQPGGHTLLLHGGSGTGKTFLLQCIAARVRDHGHPALCVTAYQLLTDLKNAYFSRTGEQADQYFSAELLLIDDLGMEPLMENITVEQIFNLVNERQMQGMSTVISTNLTLPELKARYTERVLSRLLDKRRATALAFRGKDIRFLA